MRIFIQIFLGLMCASLFAQSGVQFTNPIPVANGATYGYLRPKITLDAQNNPIVLWGKSSTHQIFVSTFNGSGFNTPVQINPVGTHPYIATWYNADIKSTGDTIIAVFPTDMPANRVFLVKSIDGGNTWSDTIRVDSIPAGGIAYFPSCDINEWGEIAVTYMQHDAGWANPRYVVTTSHNGGNTFLPDVNASGVVTGEVCDCCPAHIEYDNDRQVLIFRNNDNNVREFYSSVSVDNGASFNAFNIDQQAWYVNLCPSVAPSAMIAYDSLITVFMSGATGSNRIYVSTSTINGLQVGFTQMIDNALPAGTLQNHPKMAGKDSIMAMVWYNTMPGEADVYFRFSNTGAAGLIGDGINISNPTTGTQQNPDIAYANGTFHIIYQNNATQEIYYLQAILDEYVNVDEASMNNYRWFIQGDMLSIELLENTHPGSFLLCDVKGNVLQQTTIDSNLLQIDLNQLSKGVYFFQVGGMRKPVKFIR
jgi:hypothetical protein